MENNIDNSVYANEEEFVDYRDEREKCVVMSIKSNNKDLAIDYALMAADAFAVGVGVLGTIVFGKKFIENLETDKSNSFKSKMVTVLSGAPVLLSGAGVVLGVKNIFDRKEKLQKHLVYKKRLVKNLESFNKKDSESNDEY